MVVGDGMIVADDGSIMFDHVFLLVDNAKVMIYLLLSIGSYLFILVGDA